MTGVEDLYRASDLATQLLFVVGILLAAAFGVVTSFAIGEQYFNERTAVDIAFKDDGEILFPNVTICTTAGANVTAGEEMLVIPERVERKLKVSHPLISAWERS